MTGRILIVGLNRTNRETWVGNLQAQGFEIIQSTDSNTVENMIQEYHPDLVLMPVAVAGLNSEKIISRVRKDSQLAGIGIFGLGGQLPTDELVRWFKLGIDNYVEDTISIPLLIAQIKAYLRNTPQNLSHLASCN